MPHTVHRAGLVALWIGSAVAGFGCGAAHSPPVCVPPEPVESTRSSLWPEVPPVLHLVDCPIAVDGMAPAPPLFSEWSKEEISEWTIDSDPSGVRITSPDLTASSELSVFSLTVRASGAREAIATALLRDGGRERSQRVWRSVRQAVASGSDPTRVTFDLTEAIRGNWLDETRQAALERIEILFKGADAGSFELQSITASPADARLGGVAAGADRVDRGGIVRPAWFVHERASVRVTVQVPSVASELRWHGGGGGRQVRVIDGLRGVALASHPRSDEPWTFHAASLERWLGEEITLEFTSDAAKGTGDTTADPTRVVLFGDPRIVQVGESAGQPLSILYMIDTLRADRVGAWHSEHPAHTPTLDRLAAEGAIFKNAISTSSWTKPAIPTLMTGVLPTTHGVGTRTYADRLPETVPIVQQLYRDAGWRTASISASPLGSSLSGLDRGFGTAVLPRHWRGKIGERNFATAPDLHAALLAWHAEEPDQPSFVYVHTIDVHQYQRPYFQSEAFAGIHPYDAAVREADRHLGTLLSGIGKAPGTPQPAVIVVSDHGESFGDHGIHGHGRGLYQSQIHVPLILWAPGLIASREVRSPVSLVDVAPTLLEMAGLRFPEAVQGRSLAGVLSGDADAGPDLLGASLLNFPYAPNAPIRFALISNQMAKIIVSSGEPTYSFDLSVDPAEGHPQNPTSPQMVEAMERWISEQGAAMEAFQRVHGDVEPGRMDSAQTEQLRELGYIE